jgi:hypothetical protein
MGEQGSSLSDTSLSDSPPNCEEFIVEQLKKCRTCGVEKPLLEFVKNKQSKGGYTRRCKVCEATWRQQYYEDNKDYIKSRNNDYRNTTTKWYSRSLEKRLRYVIQLGIGRASKKKIEWNLSLEFLTQLWEKQEGKCVYSGVPLSYEDNHPHTVSLDRIDSSKGYSEDNVQFVCTIVNYVKQRFDETTFLKFCKSVTQHSNL